MAKNKKDGYIKIVLEDGFAIQKGAGIGQHTLNLSHQLRKFPEIDSVQLMEKPFLSRISSASLRRALYIAWLNSGLQMVLRRKRVDIIHFTNYLIPVLRLSKAKYVVTIHDLTAWRFPETLPRAYVSYIKWAISHAVKTADLICTVSDAVKKEIVELFNIDEEKVQTCYSGVSKEFCKLPDGLLNNFLIKLQRKFPIKPGFLLFVGTLERRKNVMTLLKAFSTLEARLEDLNLQLVLAGSPGNSYPEVRTYLEKNNLKDQVILTGYVTKEELIALYNLSRIFVFPSLYEGFGTPLLEAMACGVPIVASEIPSTKEVAKDAVFYYGEPCNAEALTQAIIKVLEDEDLQRNLVVKGLGRVKVFSWEKIAEKHLRAYREALEN